MGAPVSTRSRSSTRVPKARRPEILVCDGEIGYAGGDSIVRVKSGVID